MLKAGFSANLSIIDGSRILAHSSPYTLLGTYASKAVSNMAEERSNQRMV